DTRDPAPADGARRCRRLHAHPRPTYGPGVTEVGTPKRSLLGMLLARVGNPLNWSLVDRCLLGALVVLPFVAWYAVVEYVVLRHPQLAPYVDQAVLHRAFRVSLGLLGGWLAIIVGALFLRHRDPASRPLVHLTAQFYAVTGLAGSSFSGFYTSLFTGVAVVGGYAAGFILFERWSTLPALASFLLLVLGMTIAEQAGLIRYAPLLASEPFQHGRLSGW